MAGRFNGLGCKIVKVNFTWRVQVPFLQTTDGSHRPIESPVFSSRETPDSRWKLALFDRETKFSIFAFHYNPIAVNEVDADLLILTILDKTGNWHHHQLKPIFSLGYQIPKSECLDCIQANGKISIECKILAPVKMEPVSSKIPPGIAINCSDGLSTQLEELFDGMKFSDVVFNVEGREFPAHKLILAARSNAFAAMFEHPTKEKLTNQIKIEDVEPEVFRELLHFIYTGRLSKTTMETMATDLLIVADKYLLDEMKKECENYLVSHMCSVKCLELLLNANLLDSMEELKKITINFFQRFTDKVMATDQWQMVEHENPALMSEIQEFIFRNP